ncbi:fibronectin type III domain-containing protein [Pontiella agarivorans]|uniref:Fibronectin type III domain-containing protein n=1 Tax=Pontiella agarivorans TaxID=3038953 RepID=A0ABU5N239_9BACT|nr:fibronectin type III domain-containing protein [Pontiella agarivorans]MDZ8120508.1 fibronectin type III domain-containing protein [Pontiella agarivorans]
MKRNTLFIALLAGSGMVSAALGQSIITDDFSTYSDGDLAGQGDWLEVAASGAGAGAFNVTNNMAVSNGDGSSGLDYYVSLGNTPSGNAMDDEWDGSMECSFNWSGTKWRHGAFFKIGTSTTVTNGLRNASSDDVPLIIETGWPDKLYIGTADASGTFVECLAVTADDLGMTIGSELDSDPLEITWNVRKTRDSGFYTITASLMNTLTGSNYPGSTVSVEKPGAYAASDPYYMMGMARGYSWWDEDVQYWKGIQIDSLSLIKSAGNAPVLVATAVTAMGEDSAVNLTWDPVTEAESYDILRSDTEVGGYTAVSGGSGITTNRFTDSTAINGNVYWYKVVSKAAGAADVESEPVSGTPLMIVSGTFLDTTFAASDNPSYVDGDLAGQNGWEQLSASLPGAFEIDSSGDGVAETYGLTATGGVHQVYYTAPTSNEVTATWSGTVVFSLSTEADGFKTNVTDGVTNVYEVARLGNGYQTFMFGLTSNPDTVLDPTDGDKEVGGDDDVLVSARVGGDDGRVDISINNFNWAENIMLALNREQLGWDPAGMDISATNGADFATDTITLDYVIRKSTDNLAYMGVCTATVAGVTYEGQWHTTADDNEWGKPTVVWGEPLVYFGMSRGAPSAEQQVDVSVDSLSVTYTSSSDPVMLPPYSLDSALGNLEITVDWKNFGEELSYNIYRAETNGGPYVLLSSVPATDKFFLDTGLTDLRSYFYKVSSVYPAGESALSDPLVVRALGRTLHLEWGGEVALSAGNHWATGLSAPTVSGELNYWQGEGVEAYSVIGASDSWYANPPHPDLKAVIQAPTNSAYEANRPNVELRWNGGARFRFAEGASAMYWVECPSLDNTVNDLSGEWDKYQWYCFPAVRNGSTWYVAESSLNADRSLDLGDERWTTVTLASATDTNLMVREGTYVTGDEIGFDDINAFGFFAENAAASNDAWVDHMRLLYGSSPSVFQKWCDEQGIYNEDAVESADLDGDGADNLYEWGMGGDPLDGTDIGITQRRMYMDGDDFVYIYPRLKGVAPTYTLKAADSLVIGGFDETLVEGVDFTEVSAGGDWAGWAPEFEAVTNAIPTAGRSIRFFKTVVE